MKKLNLTVFKSIFIITLSSVTVLMTVVFLQKIGKTGADSVIETNSSQNISTTSLIEDSSTSTSKSIELESIVSLAPTSTPSPEIVSSVAKSELESKAPETPTTVPTKAIVKPINKTNPTSIPTKAIAPTTIPKPISQTKIVLDNLIGQSVSQITKVFGNPNTRELSEYGFTWYIYNSNYKNFIMIGIANDTVVGVYSNSSALNLHGLKIGSTRATVRNSLASVSFGSPLTFIKKNGVPYMISNSNQKDTFFNGTSYTTVFYDNIKGGTLTSIQMIEKNTEMLIGYYPSPSVELEKSFEKTSFYLMNAIRSRNGIALFTWDNTLSKIAKAHSVDMCVNNYFSHTNLSGLNSSARFKAAGLSYRDCAENIAKNHASAITAHESYMNSSGHRNNILRLSKNAGVGVSMRNGDILLTQNFMTYR